MYDRFTDRARKICQLANQEAQRFDHKEIRVEHMVIAMIKEGSGIAGTVLTHFGLDLGAVRKKVLEWFPQGSEVVTWGKLPQHELTKQMIEIAITEAVSLNHNYVGTEHLLLALTRSDFLVLAALGLDNLKVRMEILDLLKVGKPTIEVEADDGILALVEGAVTLDGTNGKLLFLSFNKEIVFDQGLECMVRDLQPYLDKAGLGHLVIVPMIGLEFAAVIK